MKVFHLLLVAVLAAAISFGVVKSVAPNGDPSAVQTKDTAYQRVMRTGTLRCGYVVYSDFLQKDVTTGKFSGYYYDIMEEIGRRLSLKVVWAEEVGVANGFEGLKTQRYDVLCAPYAAIPNRAREAAFTTPMVYSPMFVYARANDPRFDNNLKAIDDPSVRLVQLEGELGQVIQREEFPRTAITLLPNLTDQSQVSVDVSMGKGDVFITEPSVAQAFIDKNPGKIKRVDAPPIRMQSLGVSVAVGEEELKALLNTTIETLHSTGYIQRLFIKSEKDKDFYYLPAQPWRRAGS